MDGLPHNTSASIPDPCVRPDALRTSSFQDVCEPPFGRAAQAGFPQADFSSAIAQAIDFVTALFESEIKQKRLYYHGIEHVQAVARRSLLIFDTVVPFLHDDKASSVGSSSVGSSSAVSLSGPDGEVGWQRQRALLRLSAIAHDMIQLFVPQREPHTPRQRKSGLSELKTFEHLREFMVEHADDNHAPIFTAADIELVRRAIAATVCEIDSADGGIYQPLLYPQSARPPAAAQPAFSQLPPSLSLVPRCLALADIGTLGIDGIAAYQKEGSLLLLEENLDIVDFVSGVSAFDLAAQEVLRQRLLKRARFQVVFAKSRWARLDSELDGLPEDAVLLLKKTVFKHLNADTIATIEQITPTADHTSLNELLMFFQLEACLKEIP